MIAGSFFLFIHDALQMFPKWRSPPLHKLSTAISHLLPDTHQMRILFRYWCRPVFFTMSRFPNDNIIDVRPSHRHCSAKKGFVLLQLGYLSGTPPDHLCIQFCTLNIPGHVALMIDIYTYISIAWCISDTTSTELFLLLRVAYAPQLAYYRLPLSIILRPCLLPPS